MQMTGIIHTTHKHERVSVVKLQKAMDKIVRWADNTGFQISIEKKAIMFNRKNTTIASRPRLDTWIKGMKIEQNRKHKVSVLIFDTTARLCSNSTAPVRYVRIIRLGIRYI
jgi:hypothetical protein